MPIAGVFLWGESVSTIYVNILSILVNHVAQNIIVPKKYWLVCLGIPTSWFVIIYQYIKGI